MPESSRFFRYAPKTAHFLLTVLTDQLPRARRFVLSSPLSATDGGDGGDYTVSVGGASSTNRGVVKLTGQLGGSADLPDVRGVRVLDSTVPVLLAFGEVQEGEALVRSGASLVGTPVLPSGGGTLTGDLNLGGHKVTNLASGAATGDAATYGQLVAMLNGLDWQNSVIEKLDAPPGGPASGARYLVGTGTGVWTGHTNHIAQYEGAAWKYFVPNKGWTINIEVDGRDWAFNGANWVDLGASIDHAALLNLTTGNPHSQYQLGSQRDQNNGYAGLDAGGLVNRPVRAIRTGADPGSPAPGEAWVNGPDLKFRDNQGSPAIQLVERVSQKNAVNGYAGVGGDRRIAPSQAPLKGTYATGGDQALAPADIGAVGTGRHVDTGAGLIGGGDLTANRTLAIASFTGCVSKDLVGGSSSWAPNEVRELVVDAGMEGTLFAVHVRLPATVDVNNSIRTQAIFEFDNNSTVTVFNDDPVNHKDLDPVSIADSLMSDLANTATNNGRRVCKIILQAKNKTGNNVTAAVGATRLRGYAFPRGGGDAL